MGSSPNGPESTQRAERTPEPQWKPVLPFTRAVLYLGAFLVFLAGFQLFLLTTRTDHWFAWTIAVPLTAAFLGAFYWGSMPLALFSARQRPWALARVGMPGVAVFLWATLVTTLLHLDKFHFDSTDTVAKGAAWLWLVIYVADPPLVTIALIVQMRAPGGDPPRTSPLQGWVRPSSRRSPSSHWRSAWRCSPFPTG